MLAFVIVVAGGSSEEEGGDRITCNYLYMCMCYT